MVKFHKGSMVAFALVACFAVVCKVNAEIAAQNLIHLFDVKEIIMIGVAGAIESKLKIYDTIISNENR
jgi:nucleoside phosphorylase